VSVAGHVTALHDKAANDVYWQQAGASNAFQSMIPPQKQMTGMLGHPVAENPIDRMFDAVFSHYGLPWQFWKSDIACAQDLAQAIAALVPLGYRGMCITVPYKVDVMPMLDAVDDDVRAIGAANYITIEQGRLIGHNNDGKGVVKAIEKVAPLRGQHVVMLGAGGAGRAMAVEMAWAGAAQLTLITRREVQGREVAEVVQQASGVPCHWQPWQAPLVVPKGTSLLMNATHLGCAPELEAAPVDWSGVDPQCIAVDVITNPRITPFLSAARSHGCRVVDGVEMLVQLAMQIFERWTGISPEEAVFQQAVAAALGE
jgi:shikimate dehydrogenase